MIKACGCTLSAFKCFRKYCNYTLREREVPTNKLLTWDQEIFPDFDWLLYNFILFIMLDPMLIIHVKTVQNLKIFNSFLNLQWYIKQILTFDKLERMFMHQTSNADSLKVKPCLAINLILILIQQAIQKCRPTMRKRKMEQFIHFGSDNEIY